MSQDVYQGVPVKWHAGLDTQLTLGEKIMGAVEVDLDMRLHFISSLLVLTDRRLLTCSPDSTLWSSWSYADGLILKYHDHAGVGYLELVDDHERLACWRFTMSQHARAILMVEQFKLHNKNHKTGQPFISHEQHICPDCKTLLKLDKVDCPVCTHNNHASPKSLFRLWRFAKPYRNQLLVGFVLMLLGTLVGLIPPYLTMPLMDNVLIPYQNGHNVDPMLVTLYLTGLFGSFLLAWALDWSKTYVLAVVSERIGSDLRTTTFEHLMSLSFDYFASKRTGDLMSRISSQSDRICSFLSVQLLDFATDVLMLFMTVPMLFWIAPKLALAALIPLPLLAWMLHLVRDRLNAGYERVDRVWGEVTNVLSDTIPGIRVVKSFVQEKRESLRFRAANALNLNVNNRMNKVWSLFYPTVTLVNDLGVLVIWIFGIWQVSRGDIKVGVLTAFIAYSARFYARLQSMGRIVSSTKRCASATNRIFDILDHVSNLPEPKTPMKLTQITGSIDIKNVSFRYGSRFVNRNINLEVKPGEMIGLVGHSGAGKSTLINLICRFYDVSEGAILVDGIDIRALNMTDYRQHIGMVPQEPYLFFGTIAENIAYGKANASLAEIVAAARAAHAHEFILALPQGYDSMVGERGQSLSGGERQRISIARALLINPRILILDEATSSVDSKTEHDIQKAFTNLVKGRTTIAIAHRLSTLHRADRIVYLDHGQIIETGSHHELMKAKGAYYSLYNRQARNFIVDVEDELAVKEYDEA